MRVLVATPELAPLVRTGGLGDAVAGLSRAMVEVGVSVSVVLPRYRSLAGMGDPAPGIGPAAALRSLEVDGLEVHLVDDPPAFDRAGVYGPRPGRAFPDEWWRWGRFSLVAARLAGRHDLLHIHDGHTGPAALLSPVPTVLTVHNPAYAVQGPLAEAAELLGLGPELIAPAAPLEWYGRANFLKAGVVGATRVTTVSPAFARQITRDETITSGLAPVLRSLARPVEGILNGIDAASWDPSRDEALPDRFSADDLSGRAGCRQALMERAGWSDGTSFGMVARMSEQKGIGLLEPHLDRLVEEGFRLAAVGGGELEGAVDAWARRHPGAVWRAPYEEDLARLVFAGCDAYLMPSRFEPCGIGQMYAMRYGAPPVVRLTGGLADTVIDVDEDPVRGNGFGFRPFLPAELAKTIRRVMRYHASFPQLWSEIRDRGMRADWSWRRAAERYASLYREVAGTPG